MYKKAQNTVWSVPVLHKCINLLIEEEAHRKFMSKVDVFNDSNILQVNTVMFLSYNRPKGYG